MKIKVLQFIKFGMVGISNTIICYVVYALLILGGMNIVWANTIGFVVSIFNAFFWNNFFVFKAKEKKNLLVIFLKMFFSYMGTGLILNNILLWIWVEQFSINSFMAPFLNMAITVPLNFMLNKYWAFKDKEQKIVEGEE